MHRRLLPVGFLSLFSLLDSARGQGALRPEELAAELAAWRSAHGTSWRAVDDPATGWIEMLHGGRAFGASAPANDAEFVERARFALAAARPMLGVDEATLALDSALFLPLGQIGSTDKFTVRFRQELDGVRVVGGFANVLFDAQGRLLSLQSTSLPDTAGFSVAPSIDAETALSSALSDFAAQHGVRAKRWSTPELVVERLVAGGRRGPRLCWRIDVQWERAGSEPIGEYLSVDAATGAIAARSPSVHFFDVSGTVSALCTPGVLPDIASNPEQAHAMRHLTVTSSAGNATTDANGAFSIPGANASTQVTVRFQGPYCNVQNAAGAEHALTQTVPPGTPASVLMNPSAAASVTAQANAFRSVNALRDFVRAVNPADSRADFVALANVEVNGACNAYYNGSSINFFPAGGGCVNTSYSTIVAHELGHWMNDRYSTGNGPDGMGEGNADVWAMYVFDTPIVGQNFSGGGFIRTGTNLRQFCGDAAPGCYGQVHADGEVWMGAAWKVRANLNAARGNAQGDLAANTLFLAWLNAYNQAGIRSIIETQWLTLDDDNGNLDDGTPHFTEIDSGFRTQGFPGAAAPCPAPATYCMTSSNSVGAGARIGWTGSTRISRNDFMLHCSGVRPNATGLFFYGQTATQVPFGNGVRCIDDPFFRLPARRATAAGEIVYPLNLSALPTGGGISSGQTWRFQCYYRDVAGGGALFNTSDALAATWCP